MAGFPPGDTYRVPWTEVEVPDSLNNQVFPFVEPALDDLQKRIEKGENIRLGPLNFLKMLQWLRPFFWRVCIMSSSVDIRTFTQFGQCAGCRFDTPHVSAVGVQPVWLTNATKAYHLAE